MTDQGARPPTAHLWPARMFRVVEIVVIDAEKWLQVTSGKILQAQGLEIINLFHQTCAEPNNHLWFFLADLKIDYLFQIPLDRTKGPTWTSGATTVTLSTAMALRNRHIKAGLSRSASWDEKNNLTLDSGDQFPYQNCGCWSTPISTRCLKECRSKRFIHPKWLQLLKCNIIEKVHRYMNLIRAAGENMHHYRVKIDILKYVNRLSMIKRET